MGQNCLLADQVYSLFTCGITRFFLFVCFFFTSLFLIETTFSGVKLLQPYQVYTKIEKFEVGRLIGGGRKFHFVVVL